MPALSTSTSPATGQGLSLGQMRNEVRGYLLNTDVSSPGWTDAELNLYLNDGVFYVQQLAEYYWGMGVGEVVGGVPIYNLPKHLYQMIRTTFSQEFLPQTTEYELDRDTSSSWRGNPTGTPARHYYPQHNQIGLYPTPNTSGAAYSASPETGEAMYFTAADGVTLDTSTSGFSRFSQETGCVSQLTNTSGQSIVKFHADSENPFNSPELGILVDYKTDFGNLGFIFVANPDTMTDDSHIPQIQETAHPAVIYYALMRAFAKDGEFQDMQMAVVWWNAFQDWMESALAVRSIEWPQKVVSSEPFQQGNILQGRLQAVGPPSQLIVIGSG